MDLVRKPDLGSLTPKQRQYIVRACEFEASGIAPYRLIKTRFSCQWCGREIRNGSNSRKKLQEHQLQCELKGQRWPFAISHNVFYNHWMKNIQFLDCLRQARSEQATTSIGEAKMLIGMLSPPAVKEIGRQIQEGDSDKRKLEAAKDVLDRTLGKQPEVQQAVQVNIGDGKLVILPEQDG